jgi:hypothetical protein
MTDVELVILTLIYGFSLGREVAPSPAAIQSPGPLCTHRLMPLGAGKYGFPSGFT